MIGMPSNAGKKPGCSKQQYRRKKSVQDENHMTSGSGITQALHKKPTSQGESSSLHGSVGVPNSNNSMTRGCKEQSRYGSYMVFSPVLYIS